MSDRRAAYQEYLELYGYFGRSGLPRLTREEFERLDEEFGRILASDRPLPAELISRVARLKTILIRDRPRLSELD